MVNGSRLSFYFWFRLSVYPVHSKNKITEHYPDSQVISQQELRIHICCTLSINIVMLALTIVTVLQFCKLRYKMLLRPINLSLWYCVKDNVHLQALCPSSNCLYTKSNSTMLRPLKGKVGYELSTSFEMVKLRLKLTWLLLSNWLNSLMVLLNRPFFHPSMSYNVITFRCLSVIYP